jgi:hypothetical protein
MFKRTFKTFPAAFLIVALLMTSAMPAFAAERPVPEKGTQAYYEFLAKTVREQVEYVAGGKGTPEYKSLVEVWYRPILQEEDLSAYTYTSPRGDIAAFENAFLSPGDSKVMHDEIYRLADELDILNPNLSTAEKVSRIDAWAAGEGYRGKIIGSIDEAPATEKPWVVKGTGRAYLAGPLVNYNREIGDGYYACNERALGLMFLYRLAGTPAISLRLDTDQVAGGHVEAVYYLNGEWWFTAGRNYTDGSPLRFMDYVMSNTHADYKVDGAIKYGKTNSSGLPDNDPIVDVNESWINFNSEGFMRILLDQERYVHPEQKLTRGEVAKLLCNYLGQKPMRNLQVFSDVPTSHRYAPYIWALNKLGIMSGDGDGTFRPDDELSMQEFATVAQKMSVWYKQHLADVIKSLPYNSVLADNRSTYEELWRKVLLNFDPSPSSKAKIFADAGQIASWAKPSVDAFSQLGILSGDDKGYLNPTEPLSRLRFLVFLYKLNNRLVSGTSIEIMRSPWSTGVF